MVSMGPSSKVAEVTLVDECTTSDVLWVRLVLKGVTKPLFVAPVYLPPPSMPSVCVSDGAFTSAGGRLRAYDNAFTSVGAGNLLRAALQVVDMSDLGLDHSALLVTLHFTPTPRAAPREGSRCPKAVLGGPVR